jgi:hypothetical protein
MQAPLPGGYSPGDPPLPNGWQELVTQDGRNAVYFLSVALLLRMHRAPRDHRSRPPSVATLIRTLDQRANEGEHVGAPPGTVWRILGLRRLRQLCGPLRSPDPALACCREPRRRCPRANHRCPRANHRCPRANHRSVWARRRRPRANHRCPRANHRSLWARRRCPQANHPQSSAHSK